jgi:diguanylate cyclase (GGDEF)-like protein
MDDTDDSQFLGGARTLSQMGIADALLVQPVNKLLADNTRRAAFSYPLVWLLLALIGGYFSGPYALAATVILAIALAFSLLRCWHAGRVDIEPAELWRRRYVGLTLINVACWSALTQGMILRIVSGEMIFALLLITTGLIAAGVTYMSAVPRVALLFQAILLAPAVATMIALDSSVTRIMALLMGIYWAQMALLTLQQARYHRASILDRIKLEAYAARLKEVSEHDQLTGLANRRHFDAVFEQEWERLARSRGQLSLLMIDLDHFKQVNDTYGHMAGDVCLREMAARLQNLIRRPADLLARYGGEEFIVLLPDTDLDGAVQVAEMMRAEAAQTPLPVGDQAVPVTLSVGVAMVYPSRTQSRDELLKRVDDALYSAKAGGRNRVVVSAAEDPDRAAECPSVAGPVAGSGDGL